MRRLYSTFAAGWPGTGLLLMRIVVGATLIVQASSALRDPSLNAAALTSACMALLGLLLIPGLWTPMAGTLVVLVEIVRMWIAAGDPWVALLVATIGCALAMLGPGHWSVDARLFGWKRVAASPRGRRMSPPTAR